MRLGPSREVTRPGSVPRCVGGVVSRTQTPRPRVVSTVFP